MRFLVIGIDRNTGAAVLLTETPSATREDAIGALESLAASELHDLGSYDLVLVDLDAGTPVLVVTLPAPQQETLPEPEPLHVAEPGWSVEPPPEPPAAAQQFADTAVSALTSEAHAEAAAPAETVAFAPDAFAAVEEPPTGPEPSSQEDIGPFFGPDETRADELVEPPAEPEAEPSPPPADDDSLLDALRRAADSLVQQGIEVPEPLEQPTPLAVDEAPEAAAPRDTNVVEPLGVAEAAAAAASPVEHDLRPDLEPVRPVIMGEYPETIEPTSEKPVAAQPYEPSGELEIAAYTCNDCVYSNTCPKAGESSPADCGTFQWRSF